MGMAVILLYSSPNLSLCSRRIKPHYKAEQKNVIRLPLTLRQGVKGKLLLTEEAARPFPLPEYTSLATAEWLQALDEEEFIT